MAVDWNQIYEQKWNEAQKGYDEQKAAYDNAHAIEQGELDNTLNTGKANLAKTRDEALRQAYVSKMQNERQMPALLRTNGINGGASETSVSSMLRNYQNSRNAANNSYAQGETDLTNTYNTNKAALGSRYQQLYADLLKKRKDDTWNQTEFAYNAAKAAEQAAEEKRRWEIQLENEKAQNEENRRRWEAEQAEAKRQFDLNYALQTGAYGSGSGGSSGGGGYYSSGGGSGSSGSGSIASKPSWWNTSTVVGANTTNKKTINSPMNGTTSSSARVASNPQKAAQALLAIQNARRK